APPGPLYIDGGTFTAAATTTFAGTGDSEIEATTYNNLGLSPSSNTSTATLDDPTEDGYIHQSFSTYTRDKTGDNIRWSYDGLTASNNGYVEWDISSIADVATITLVKFKYHAAANEGVSCIYAMANQPSVQDDDDTGNATIHGDAKDGTAYLSDNDTFPETAEGGTNKAVGPDENVTWNTDPKADVQSALADDWFAFGFSTPEYNTNKIYSENKEDPAADPKPTLYVEYTLPTPTYTLGTSTGQTININGNLIAGDGTHAVIVTASTTNPTLDVNG
ncbi:unnamed protein product, partial [marine sediment metagenome]